MVETDVVENYSSFTKSGVLVDASTVKQCSVSSVITSIGSVRFVNGCVFSRQSKVKAPIWIKTRVHNFSATAFLIFSQRFRLKTQTIVVSFFHKLSIAANDTVSLQQEYAI